MPGISGSTALMSDSAALHQGLVVEASSRTSPQISPPTGHHNPASSQSCARYQRLVSEVSSRKNSSGLPRLSRRCCACPAGVRSPGAACIPTIAGVTCTSTGSLLV